MVAGKQKDSHTGIYCPRSVAGTRILWSRVHYPYRKRVHHPFNTPTSHKRSAACEQWHISVALGSGIAFWTYCSFFQFSAAPFWRYCKRDLYKCDGCFKCALCTWPCLISCPHCSHVRSFPIPKNSFPLEVSHTRFSIQTNVFLVSFYNLPDSKKYRTWDRTWTGKKQLSCKSSGISPEWTDSREVQWKPVPHV